MLSESYYQLKAELNNETLVLEQNRYFAAGTVYTPIEIAYSMLYYLLKNDWYIHQPFDEMNFERVWNVFMNVSHEEMAFCPNIHTGRQFDYYKNKTIMDPCCGTGMLLMPFAEWMIFLAEFSNQPIEETLEHLFYYQIHAADINGSALEKYQLLIDSIFNHFNVTLKTDRLNLFCVDSLLYQPSQIFDLVISNPPYIGEKGHKSIFDQIKKTSFGQKYYEGKMDYFYFFVYKAYEIVSDQGSCCFLSSNYFFTADGAHKLRQFLREHFYLHFIRDYHEKEVFKNIKIHACIYTMQKRVNPKIKYIAAQGASTDKFKQLDYQRLFDDQGMIHFVVNDIEEEILQKMKAVSTHSLKAHYDVHQGIVSGADRTNKANGDKPIFVLKNEELKDFSLLKSYLRPFFKNRHIHHYVADEEPEYYIVYTKNSLISEALSEHLKPFKEKLLKRREVKKGIRQWYELTWPREEMIFKGPKIIAPQRAITNKFAYTDAQFYASADVYFIVPKEPSLHASDDMKRLTLLLNSELYRFWLYKMGKKKGQLLELYATPLKEIPMISLTDDLNKRLAELSTDFYFHGTIGEESLKRAVDQLLFNYLKLSDPAKQYIMWRKYESRR